MRKQVILLMAVGHVLVGCVVPVPVPVAGSSTGNTAIASTAVPVTTASEQDLLVQVNGFRASQGQGPLNYSPVLAQVAQSHSDDLLGRGTLSHQGADGSSVGDRARRAGYGWCLIAENLAQGHKTLGAAMGSWETSPGHRANLLNSGLTEVGLGRSGDTWAMVFGAPGC